MKSMSSAMKKIGLLLTFMLLVVGLRAQPEKEWEKYIQKVDQMQFTDTIHLQDSMLGQIVNVIGYEVNDTLYKAELTYPGLGRKRITYHRQGSGLFHSVCHLIEFDLQTETKVAEIKAWEEHVFFSNTKKLVDKGERKDPELALQRSDYSIQIEFKKVDLRAKKYWVTGTMVEAVPLPAYCGTFAMASAYKFKVLESDLEPDAEFIVAKVQCPRSYGEDFFVTGATYRLRLATNSGVTFGWLEYNQYEGENLPTFWARSIEPVE